MNGVLNVAQRFVRVPLLLGDRQGLQKHMLVIVCPVVVRCSPRLHFGGHVPIPGGDNVGHFTRSWGGVLQAPVWDVEVRVLWLLHARNVVTHVTPVLPLIDSKTHWSESIEIIFVVSIAIEVVDLIWVRDAWSSLRARLALLYDAWCR